MASNSREIAAALPQDIATLPLNQAIDAYAPNFKAVLPANVSLGHFKRMVVTAINTNPDLAGADRRSLLNACIKCASDGLLPDGREAALVVFNTKIRHKVGNAWQEEWVKLAQFMPMIAGIRKRMRNSGDVISATAEVVYENDEFDYALGDDPFIRHTPAPFGRSRGSPVGAYAIIKLKDGETLRDVMRREEIEAARSKSRAPDSLMWKDFWGEGAKKTVLRRCAKAAPQSAMLESLLARDDESPDMPPLAELAPPEPEPPRGAAITHQPEPEQEEKYFVTDCDGEVHYFNRREPSADKLDSVLAEARRRGTKHVDAVLEDNAILIDAIGIPAYLALAGHIEPQPDSTAGHPNPRETGKPTIDARPLSAEHTSAPERTWSEDELSKHHEPLPTVPTDNEQNRWDDKINAKLADGVDPALIRAANAANIEHLRICDPVYHADLMQRLGAR